MSRILIIVITLASTLAAQMPKPSGGSGGGGGGGDVTQAGDNAMTGANTFTKSPVVGALPFRVGPASASYEATQIQPVFDESGVIVGMLNHATLIAAFRAINENNSANNFGVGLSGVAASTHTSGTRTQRNGFEGIAYQIGVGGTLTTALGGAAWCELHGGTITTCAALRAQAPVVSAGTLVNAIGLDIEAITQGTTLNYAIRTQGTTPSLFGGHQLLTVAAAPGTPSAGLLSIYAKTGKVFCFKDDAGTETCPGAAGSSAFSALTSATNTTAAMVVGSGASLGVSGTGTITATQVPVSAGAAPTADGTLAYDSTAEVLKMGNSGTSYPVREVVCGAGADCSNSGSTTTVSGQTSTMQSLDNEQKATPIYCSSTGSGSTLTCSVTPSLTAQAALGSRWIVMSDTACAANPTLNISSQGALNIQRSIAGTLTNLAANECRANIPFLVIKAASAFVMVPMEQGGDASSNTATSVDSEIALFSGTAGKTIKRATATGILKGASGVLSAAAARTDYVTPYPTASVLAPADIDYLADYVSVSDESAGADKKVLAGNLRGNPRRYFYCEIEFIGNVAFTNNTGSCELSGAVSGGTVAIASAGEQTAPGIANVSTSTSATGAAGLTTSPAAFRFGAGTYTAESRVRITTLSDGTETYSFRSGFIDATTTEAVDGCFFRYTDSVDSGKWQGVCRNNNTETVTTAGAGTTVAAATWYQLTVTVNAAGTSVDFQINGTSIGTVTTNIPTGAGRETGWRPAAIIKSAGTTARTADLDYASLGIQFTAAR